MIAKNGPVELHPALFWICNECGGDNFVRSFTAPLSEEEREEAESLTAVHGLSPVMPLYQFPTSLICTHCQTSYDDITFSGVNIG